MDRLRAGQLRRGDDAALVQIALLRRGRAEAIALVRQRHVQRVAIRLGIHGDGGDAHLLTGADDAHGNLAAVGDQNAFEHGKIPPESQYYDSRYYNQLLIPNLP